MAEAMTAANRELRRLLEENAPKGKPRQKVANALLCTFDGVEYDSQGEAEFAVHLTRGLLPAFVGSLGWQRQVEFALSEKRRYTADFVISMPTGQHVVEVKGRQISPRLKKIGAFWHVEARLRWEWCQQRFPNYKSSVWVPHEGRLVKVEG